MTTFSKKCNIFFLFSFLNITFTVNAFSIHSILINNLDIQGLKNDIHLKLKQNHRNISYKQAKKLLSTYDLLKIYEQNNCQFSLDGCPYEDNIIKGNIRKHQITNYNLEHIYPQSKGTKNKIAKSDLHNLFLCNNLVNFHRSNYKFTDTTYLDNNDSLEYLDKKGNKIIHFNDQLYPKTAFLTCKSSRKKIFVPTYINKGIISRAIAYISIRYNLPVEQVIDPPFLLIEWSNQYPPSNVEIIRNNWISKIQGNHNLFISHPELLSFCFADLINSEQLNDENKFTQIFNPFNNNFVDVIDNYYQVRN